MMRFAVVPILALLASCSSPTGPEPYRPPGAERFLPPSIYLDWWEEAEGCVGAQGDFFRVRWFEVPGESWYTPTWDALVDGAWIPPDDIYIAETKVYDLRVVKHEMVHELLDGGDLDDPRFKECSGIGHSQHTEE